MRTIRPLLLAAPALVAALLIAGAPLIQAMHLAECECRGCYSCGHEHRELAESFKKHAPQCCPHEACAHPHEQTASSKGEEEPDHGRGRHQHDSSTCPICQMYMALAKGFTTSASAAQVGVALTEHISITPRQSAPAYEHVSTASPRAPPCC